ncbi:MAG: hypothetical protein Q8N51_15860 [Gammaproteobacteria bacterium]|nr:hypothetical protein [Gammaproteobacteria bacterium]
MRRSIPALLLLVLPLLALAGPDEAHTSQVVDSAEFARLKTLAGTWLLADESGQPTKNVGSVFKVVSQGHSIQETMFPGTDEEMVNMYYRDGAATEMVHYCAGGNQPRVSIRATSDPNVLSLEFIAVSNLASADVEHMHSGRYILEGSDRLRTEWVSWKAGKAAGTTEFRLVRQVVPAP